MRRRGDASVVRGSWCDVLALPLGGRAGGGRGRARSGIRLMRTVLVRGYSTRRVRDSRRASSRTPATPHPALPRKGGGCSDRQFRRRQAPAVRLSSDVRPRDRERIPPATRRDPPDAPPARDLLPAILLACCPAARRRPAEKPGKPVAAAVESTLATASDKIRQFAFDGDDATYFASEDKPGDKDSFTLDLRRAGAPSSRSPSGPASPTGPTRLEAGTLEGSAGSARRSRSWRSSRTARRRPSRAGQLKVDPDQAGGRRERIRWSSARSRSTRSRRSTTFKYPVEFTVDVSDAPEMKDWAEKAARTCERWYGRINEELKSDGYKPIRRVRMSLKKGIGAAGHGRRRPDHGQGRSGSRPTPTTSAR